MDAMKKTLEITGMMCAHCEKRVKDALEALPQVESAATDREAGTAVVVLCAPAEDNVLAGAVTEAGYKVIAVK